MIVCVVTALLIVAAIAYAIVDYGNYKEGQRYGVELLMDANELAGTNFFDKNGSYEEHVISAYSIFGNPFRDATEIENMLEEAMRSAGYDRYENYAIRTWFQYDNFQEYFKFEYCCKTLPMVCYVMVVFTITFTFLVKMEEKKEILVSEDGVVCKKNAKESIQLLFDDIKAVNVKGSRLKLIGTKFKFI